MLAIPFVVASSPLVLWLENSVRLARFLTPFMLAASVVLELARRRSKAGWWRGFALRSAVVICLLLGWRGRTVYGTALGWLLDTALDVELVSRASWGQLTEVTRNHQQSALALGAGGVGPPVLRSAVAATPRLLQAWLLGMASLARLVASGLGVMGPVVLALSIPGGAGGVARWARGLLTVLAWPILIAVLVDLTVGLALGHVSPTHVSDAASQAVALGMLLGGVALAVPFIGWAGASSALKAGAVAWRACAGIPAALRHLRVRKASVRPEGRDREDTGPSRDPAKRARQASSESGWSSESASMDGSEPPRATPAQPRAGPRIEGLACRPPMPLSPAIPPVVPREVRHRVRRPDAALPELPTSPEGIEPSPRLRVSPGRRPTTWPPKVCQPPPWPPGDCTSSSADRTSPFDQTEAIGKTDPVMKASQADQANRLRRSR